MHHSTESRSDVQLAVAICVSTRGQGYRLRAWHGLGTFPSRRAEVICYGAIATTMTQPFRQPSHKLQTLITTALTTQRVSFKELLHTYSSDTAVSIMAAAVANPVASAFSTPKAVAPPGQPDISYAPDYEKYQARAARRVQSGNLPTTLPEGFPQQLKGDLVWEGNTLAETYEWTYVLSEDQLAEIDHAVRHFKCQLLLSGTRLGSKCVHTWLISLQHLAFLSRMLRRTLFPFLSCTQSFAVFPTSCTLATGSS